MELIIEELSKTYPGDVKALDRVSLTIPQGLFGLLGPNGAGKSTLMRTIATLQEADEGAIRFDALDVLRDKEQVRRCLGYLPQEFGLYPKVTARDLLDHFAVLKGIGPRKARKARVRALLEQTNLWEVRNKKVGAFSGGMRQRFGIAVALLGAPRLIIVDEPTAGLDPAERARFLNLLSELGQDRVVMLSTHIVDDVEVLCSRMAIIDEGRILLEAQPAEAIGRLEGRVWQRTVDKAELPGLEQELSVIRTRMIGGQTTLRALGDEAPGEAFEPAAPDLEDVYFVVLKGLLPESSQAPAQTPPAGETEDVEGTEGAEDAEDA
jgi:ABC-2 type transport system ATP-binding protein